MKFPLHAWRQHAAIVLTVFLGGTGGALAQELPAPDESVSRAPGLVCKARVGAQTASIGYVGASIYNASRRNVSVVCPVVEHDNENDDPINRVLVHAMHMTGARQVSCRLDVRRTDGRSYFRSEAKKTGDVFPRDLIIFGQGEFGTPDEGFVGLHCVLPPRGRINGIETVQGLQICVGPGNPDAVCPTVVEPVCGCDNVTYNNSCLATAAGVTRSTDGACTN